MSRVNFGAKPNMYPLPVLIIATYDKDGNPDAMNAAWGVVTDFNEISISMGSNHKNVYWYMHFPNGRLPNDHRHRDNIRDDSDGDDDVPTSHRRTSRPSQSSSSDRTSCSIPSHSKDNRPNHKSYSANPTTSGW